MSWKVSAPKNPVVDFIFIVIELFRYLLRLRRYEQKSVKVSVFRWGVGHFERRFQREGGIAHQPLLVSENCSDSPFVWYQNIRSALFGFVTKHACDRRTDGHNYDSQDQCRHSCITW